MTKVELAICKVTDCSDCGATKKDNGCERIKKAAKRISKLYRGCLKDQLGGNFTDYTLTYIVNNMDKLEGK